MEFLKIDTFDKLINPPYNKAYSLTGRYSDEPSVFLIDKSLEAIKNFITKKTVLKENSKVFFMEESVFPVSMLSKITKDFTKTNNIEKANYIISKDIDCFKIGILYIQDNCLYRTYLSDSILSSLDEGVFIPSQWDTYIKEKDVYYFTTFDNIENLSKHLNDCSKMVQTKTFCEAIYNKKDKLSSEEFDNLYVLFNSKTLRNIKLAIATSLYYKIEEEEKVFIIEALRSYFNRGNNQISQFNKTERFFFYRLGYSPKEIFSQFFIIEYSLRDYIINNNVPISIEQRRKLLNPEQTIRNYYSRIKEYEDMCNIHVSFIPKESEEQRVPDKDPRIEYIVVQVIADLTKLLYIWLNFFQITIKIEFNESK